jgi:hypothetical protein
MNDWDVEGALNKVVAAIQEGSPLLSLKSSTGDAVKDMYRSSFSARTAAEWQAAKATILELARSAGHISEFATIVLQAKGCVPVAKSLDEDTVCCVCVMVSRFDCGLTDGAFCPDVEYNTPVGQELDQILQNLP